MAQVFIFDGGSLEVKSTNGVMQVIVTDTAGTPHTLNVPKNKIREISSVFSSVEKELQELTPEQKKAVSERWGKAKENGQPF